MVSDSTSVLLIEDNLGDIVSIRTMMISDGVFKLKFALNLDEALKTLENENFDVVLMDLGLPDSQGFRTFIQVHNKMPEVPIIIITGLEDEDLGVNAVKEGAQDYLVKGQVDKKLLARSLKFAIERKQTEEDIKSLLFERDVLLKETHHRVKNNMQVIHSLLNLQTHYAESSEVISALKESQNRVKSLGLMHEKIYNSSDRSKIDFNGYVNSLIVDLFSSNKLNGRIEPIIDIGLVDFNLETAILCGLIINELVSNSIKHAFPNNRTGKINISINSNDSKYKLIISDDGIGFPDKDFKQPYTLGFQIVNNLTDQLEGKIKLDSSIGTKYTINFDYVG